MADTENVAVPDTKKKSRLIMWLIIAAAILLLSGGGFVAVNRLGATKPAPRDTRASEAESGAMSRVKSVMSLDAFLVNLADLESTRFVKVTFRLGLDEPGVGEEYAGNTVILAATRDRIISILSTKTADEILTPEGKDRLRIEIRDKVNPILPRGKVVDVFIMDFVVQL